MNKNYYAILMAGGVGSRFWPASTTENPKQFQDILGSGATLLQTTFSRLSRLMPKENIFILTNKAYNLKVKEQIPEINQEQIVLEPVMRNTAPSILLGALKIKKKDKDALIVVAPSDHWIEGEEAFLENVNLAFNTVAKENKLITLGVQPSMPNTGYGYIKYDDQSDEEVKPVLRFTEKPSFSKAQEFLKEGNYVWNAGIFIWSASFIIDNFKEYLPEMYRLFKPGEEVLNTSEEQKFLDENYAMAPAISIDYGIMENSTKVFVIPASFQWNDLGTWGSLQEELPHDASENTVINAHLLALNATQNIIRTEKPKIVVVEGIKDYIIVENEKVLLVVPKNKEQEIKEIRQKVMKKYGENYG